MATKINKLDLSHLEIRHGLSQLVQSVTRRNNILDVFYTNRPDMFRIKCDDLLCEVRPQKLWLAMTGVVRRLIIQLYLILFVRQLLF